MRKLEIRELAAYLPYGLKAVDDEGNVGSLAALFEDCIYLRYDLNVGDYEFNFEDIKPLLIPMSELNKQAKSTVSGIRNIDKINSKASYNIKYKGGETFFYDLPEHMPIEDVWDTYEQLFANHYDVFNLIPNGLALNKLDY